VARLHYKHPVERSFHKIVYQIYTLSGVHKRTLIAYEWHCDPYEVYGLPHGNCRHTAESFQPSLPSQRVRPSRNSLATANILDDVHLLQDQTVCAI
jgi:hypothetical protein